MRKQLLILLLIGATALTACAHGRKTTRKKVKKATVTAPVKGLSAVAMRRGACFGRCPEYVLTINSSGIAEYTGIRNAAVTGVYQKNIGAAQAQALLNEFMDYRADTCSSLYKSMIADLPGLHYTLTINGKQKLIGNAGFGPPYLTSLGAEMDALGSVDATWKKISDKVPEE